VVSPVTPVSSINKTDGHNIDEILLKVALNTINQTFVLSVALAGTCVHHKENNSYKKHNFRIIKGLLTYICIKEEIVSPSDKSNI